MLTFRAALEPDLDRLVEIHLAAFPDARGEAARLRNFADNALGTLDDLHVAELDGILVAHAFLFPLSGWFGAQRVAFGGIASVGVAPEARGIGVARALLDHLHDLAHARGDAFTLLYAFRQAFYARLGYGPVTPSKRLSFAPRSVYPGARALVQASGVRVRAATSSDRSVIEELYERASARSEGRMLRPLALWNARFSDERRQWFIVWDGKTAIGYMAFAFDQTETHGKVTATVRDFVALDRNALLALLTVLGGLRDQVTEIQWEVAWDDPVDRYLVDADSHAFGTAAVEHPLGVIVGGPLVRVVDLERALLARGYRHDGELDLEIDGSRERAAVRVREGRAFRVAAEVKGPDSFHLTVDPAAVASLLYGGLKPSEAYALGFLTGDESAVRNAEHVLHGPVPFSSDAF